MNENFYTASLSRTQGRNTWAIIFRHPKRTDPTTGKAGLRVRQSLKTDNEQDSAALRDQMSALLASPNLWDIGAREQALAAFDQRIVDIFFYKLEGGETDFLALRDGVIELPSPKSSGYRRALFLGTTGAGKTTLLRQIMGTDPDNERFPSTSTAKTTVHETEVVLQEGPFRAVVTFFPMEDVREHLKECVSAAVLAAYRKESDGEQMRRLLMHVNQRFRFNYLLGNGPVKNVSDFDDDSNGDPEAGDGDLLKCTNEVLAHALASVKSIAERYFGPAMLTEGGRVVLVIIAKASRVFTAIREAQGVGLLCWRWPDTPTAYVSFTLWLRGLNTPRPMPRWFGRTDDPVVQRIRHGGAVTFVIATEEGRVSPWFTGRFGGETKEAATVMRGVEEVFAFDTPGIAGTTVGQRTIVDMVPPDRRYFAQEIRFQSDPAADFWSTLNYHGPWWADLAAAD